MYKLLLLILSLLIFSSCSNATMDEDKQSIGIQKHHASFISAYGWAIQELSSTEKIKVYPLTLEIIQSSGANIGLHDYLGQELTKTSYTLSETCSHFHEDERLFVDIYGLESEIVGAHMSANIMNMNGTGILSLTTKENFTYCELASN
ncbi:DUF4830 domain-containing protein [Longirhabdus pacifica]|uniref:DUF4830 domain-containing protein n=1 Tax=Longirhabdus pacifica TaxID=2305227 RepID=UPI001008F569|nr:DUF4830 domain-containing protein [Longirhabdus pacifica]